MLHSDACFALSTGPPSIPQRIYKFIRRHSFRRALTFVRPRRRHRHAFDCWFSLMLRLARTRIPAPLVSSEHWTAFIKLRCKWIIYYYHLFSSIFIFVLAHSTMRQQSDLDVCKDGRTTVDAAESDGRPVDACSQRPMSHLCAASINKNYCLRRIAVQKLYSAFCMLLSEIKRRSDSLRLATLKANEFWRNRKEIHRSHDKTHRILFLLRANSWQ